MWPSCQFEFETSDLCILCLSYCTKFHISKDLQIVFEYETVKTVSGSIFVYQCIRALDRTLVKEVYTVVRLFFVILLTTFVLINVFGEMGQ